MGVLLTKVPLPASNTYTQGWVDRFQEKIVAAVRGLAYSDKAGTLYLEESDDAGVTDSDTATIVVVAETTTELPWTALTKRWYRFKYVNGGTAQGSFVLIQDTVGMEQLNVKVASSALPAGVATEATSAAILAKIIAAPATEAKQDTLIAKDFATETTSASILAKIIAAPATEAKQDTLIAKDFATETTSASILAKIIAAPATEAKQDTLIAKDFATQTTLAAILAKIIAAPATEATLLSVLSALAAPVSVGIDGSSIAVPVDIQYQSLGNNLPVAVASSALPTGAATEATSAAILAKIIAAPATEAKQDTLIAKDFATQTTLAAVLAKIIAAPATEAKQDTLIAKDFATQTTLAAVLAKIITAPATEAKQDTLIAKDFATQTTLALIKDTDGIKKITDTVNVAMTSSTSTATATIANGASLSGEADIGAYTYVAIMMPAAWTAADLTFQASNDSAGTFYDVYDDAGIEVQVSAAASRVIGLDLAALKLASLRYIKVRSGTTGTPVAQGAERVLTLILKK